MKIRRLFVILGVFGFVFCGSVACRNESVDCPSSMVSEDSNASASGLKGADSYDEVYQVLNQMVKDMEYQTYDCEETCVDDAATSTASNSSASIVNDYEKTNVQVEGVDEGDCVKNDGSYLYVMDSDNGDRNVIHIVDITGIEMKEAAEIKMEEGVMVTELYRYQDLLLILYNTYVESRETRFSNMVCYDVNNPENPKKCESFHQEGDVVSSRIADGYLYLVSCKENVASYDDKTAKYICEDSIPYINDCVQSCENIYLTGEEEEAAFITVSSVSLKNFGKKKSKVKAKDSLSVLSGSECFYMSETSMYITEQKIKDGEVVTDIRRFSYQDGTINGEAKGEVPGAIYDTFALNEDADYVRIVTTGYKKSKSNQEEDIYSTDAMSNGLYILDMDLCKVGCVEDIASGETVKSARFMGDIGYFVTFREIDPLFSVDLSDPKNPEIIGELKIPGFSEYLHVYSDDLLLGIGLNVEEDENSASGIKLSMFDISDPAEVKEVAKLVLPNYDYSNGLYDYKDVLISTEKNLFGFEAEGYSDDSYVIDFLRFSYDEENEKFVMEQQIEHIQKNVWYMKGTYAGEKLYVIENCNKIASYNIKTKKKMDEIQL